MKSARSVTTRRQTPSTRNWHILWSARAMEDKKPWWSMSKYLLGRVLEAESGAYIVNAKTRHAREYSSWDPGLKSAFFWKFPFSASTHAENFRKHPRGTVCLHASKSTKGLAARKRRKCRALSGAPVASRRCWRASTSRCAPSVPQTLSGLISVSSPS